VKEVILHDGSAILLKKLDESHDPTDKLAAIRLLEEARAKQHFITGLIYVNGSRPSLSEHERLGDVPLAALPEARLRPPRATLEKIMAGMK
jgi:2-oxoglutarate ferredoxin oxidoreductase subunit beta